MLKSKTIKRNSSHKVTILRVSDGDSLLVEMKTGEQFRVRLFGIDAPELSQPFGQQAKVRLQELVGLEAKIFVLDVDRYGRLVANIKNNSLFGPPVNIQMIRSGLAHYYPDYGVLKNGEKEERKARRKRMGIWHSGKDFETPWEYRQRARADRESSGKRRHRKFSLWGWIWRIAVILISPFVLIYGAAYLSLLFWP